MFVPAYQEEGKVINKADKPILFTAALNTWNTTKGEDRGELAYIVFDEFMTRDLYLKDEFAKIAKEKSDDIGSADLGGDLGYFKRNEMVPEFDKAVFFDLKKGKMTEEPVKTEHGFHIILKIDEKEKPELKEAKKEIVDALVEKKLADDNKLNTKGLIDIRKKYDMKITDPKLAEQYAQYMNYLLNTDK